MKDVRKILKKRPLLFDGGMGTYYKAKPGQECEQANLLDPDGILTVHRAYLEAGADAIKTNTFGLPRMAAAQNPMWEAMADEGWKLAAQAAVKTSAAVFADLGPAPDTEALPAAQIYTALAERFAALGAKNFLFETLSSDAGVAEAAKKIKETVPDAFVLVSFAVLPDGYTREGRHCAELVRSMTACGAVDAVGLNCVSAPGAMRTLVQQLGRTELPLSVMPNAGYPVVTRTRVQYQGRPEYFARELARLAAEGVRILGGCCGTTAEHVAALRAAVEAVDFSAFVPPRRDPDVIPCASEKEARFITPDIDVGETIECTSDLLEDILEAEENAPQGALKIAIYDEDDLYTFAENQYAVKDALCLWTDVPELLEQALRLYQGRAFWDGTGELEAAFLQEMARKYGLVLL